MNGGRPPIPAGLPETADRDGTSPRLGEEQMVRLRGLGRSRTTAHGDVRSGSIKRVASAVGEGSMAVRLVHDRLAAH